MASLMPNGKQQYTNSAGMPLIGGKVFTYAAGTTTPKATYTDQSGSIANPNPVILNIRGEAAIWWSGNYKVVVKDAFDNLIYTADNYKSVDKVASEIIESVNASLALTAMAVNTIAGLRALTDFSRAVLLLGYYATGDKESRLYNYIVASTVTDNGGTVIKPASAGSAGRWVMAQPEAIKLSDFGAFPSQPDSTTSVQSALDFAAPLLLPLTGDNQIYNVVTVKPKTGQRLKDAVLKSIGSTTLSYMKPVIHLDGEAEKLTNLQFTNVIADGNRGAWTNVDPNGGGQGEDGGMHAWRVTVNSASIDSEVSNVLWVDCEGINSATAGLAVHNISPSATVADYKVKNLIWRGGKLKGNRQHGFFASGFDGISFEGYIDMRRNGLDLNTTDPFSHGNRGARSGGYLFGAGFDLETYGVNFVGSLYKNFFAEKLDCRDCATPSIFYSPIPPNVAGYASITGINITGIFNRGFTGPGSNPLIDYSLKVQGDLLGTAYTYNDVVINGVFSDLPVVSAGVRVLEVDGVMTNTSPSKLVAVNCKFIDAEILGSAPTITITPSPTLQTDIVAGTTTAIISYSSVTGAYAGSDGGLTYLFEGTISGALNAQGDLIVRITNLYQNSSMIINSLSASNTTAALSSSWIKRNIIQTDILFDTAQSSLILFNFTATFYPQ